MRPKSRYQLELRSQRKKIKRQIRRRGYNDKGSLRPAHTWLPWNAYSEPDREPLPEITFLAPRRYQWVDKKLYHAALQVGQTTFERYNSLISEENHSSKK
jgi:hypothetical protein